MKIKSFGRRKYSYYMSLMVHGSLARELPKAEGVAFGVAGILSVAGNLLVRGSRRFSRNTAVALRPKATPSGAAAPAPSRGSLGVVLPG